MPKCSVQRIQGLLSSLRTVGPRQRHRRGRGRFTLITILLLMAIGGKTTELGASGMAPEITVNSRATEFGVSQRLPAVSDPVYDHFLQGFRPLHADARRRSYLVAEVVTAANQNRIDPDLLFALVAVESNFNSTAVSPKGARGLGQIMFATGRMVAPRIVREPEDLYSVPRNLHVTALYLRRLLIERNGDLRTALAAYRTGAAVGHLLGRDDTVYVDRICRHFAFLKTKREYREMTAMAVGSAAARRD